MFTVPRIFARTFYYNTSPTICVFFILSLFFSLSRGVWWSISLYRSKRKYNRKEMPVAGLASGLCAHQCHIVTIKAYWLWATSSRPQALVNKSQITLSTASLSRAVPHGKLTHNQSRSQLADVSRKRKQCSGKTQTHSLSLHSARTIDIRSLRKRIVDSRSAQPAGHARPVRMRSTQMPNELGASARQGGGKHVKQTFSLPRLRIGS